MPWNSLEIVIDGPPLRNADRADSVNALPRSQAPTGARDARLPPRSARSTSDVAINDETLRDGLQSPSARIPSWDQQVQLLHLMNSLLIDAVNIGMPSSGAAASARAVGLAREIQQARLAISANASGRTLENDVIAISEVAQASGIGIEANLFVGCSPVRQLVEERTLGDLLRLLETAIRRALSEGLLVNFVTEDTTRTPPHVLETLYTEAVRLGATRVSISDTVGHATPAGVRAVIRFVKKTVAKTGSAVRISWHGHRDRGLALANALSAIQEEVDRVDATALGVGERCGNLEIELLLLLLQRAGARGVERAVLRKYCELVARSVLGRSLRDSESALFERVEHLEPGTGDCDWGNIHD